jgi:hypothetical protein
VYDVQTSAASVRLNSTALSVVPQAKSSSNHLVILHCFMSVFPVPLLPLILTLKIKRFSGKLIWTRLRELNSLDWTELRLFCCWTYSVVWNSEAMKMWEGSFWVGSIELSPVTTTHLRYNPSYRTQSRRCFLTMYLCAWSSNLMNRWKSIRNINQQSFGGWPRKHSFCLCIIADSNGRAF